MSMNTMKIAAATVVIRATNTRITVKLDKLDGIYYVTKYVNGCECSRREHIERTQGVIHFKKEMDMNCLKIVTGCQNFTICIF